jgi:hypothetical protein
MGLLSPLGRTELQGLHRVGDRAALGFREQQVHMLGHRDESVDMQPIRLAGAFQGPHEEVADCRDAYSGDNR